MAEYATLAGVYDWLTPDALLTPAGNVAAFAAYVELSSPRRLLDCACGTGRLAVGLALQGHEVVATDASAEMVARTAQLAAEHGVQVDCAQRRWDELPDAGWEPFDAIFCVGNSLVHAAGTAERRAALAAMAGLLAPGGTLVVTSRNWTRVRDAGSRVDAAEQPVRRHGRDGLVSAAWEIGADWDAPHHVTIAVAFTEDDGAVTTHAERMPFWPFTERTLMGELRDAGLTRATSTYADDVDRYLVTAVRTV